MADILFWLAVSFLFFLLLAPIGTYLIYGWDVRRREILTGLDSRENAAITLYFQQFHSNFETALANNPDKQFQAYYRARFGRHHFVLPLILLAGLMTVLLFQCSLWVQELLVPPSASASHPPVIALLAIMGAYMWVLYDQITRWWYSDLSPGDLYWASFRFAVAAPMGYAVSALVARDLAMTLAFLLGAFPTNTLFSVLRRVGRQKLGLAESSVEGAESELQNLQGIDFRRAERFASEGITTIWQLANADPIGLTILTNMGYTYVVDCMSQALLWIHVEKDILQYRRYGLRGAYEVESLWKRLQNGTPQEQGEVQQLLEKLAVDMKSNEIALRNILREVTADSYTKFIYISLSGLPV